MVGASKILTVSYGTFSCTLEGFDDPFSTMKAIAEYFRELAAEDRYFGAEPPTPDAEMLHRIAEREIQRRVEAKIEANGVVLRQEDSAAPEAPPRVTMGHPAAPAPSFADPKPAEAPAVDATVLHVEAPVAAAVAAPVVEDSEDDAPVLHPVAEAGSAEAESVAAKLMRIRAAVADSRAAAPESEAAAPAAVPAPEELPAEAEAAEVVAPEAEAFVENAPLDCDEDTAAADPVGHAEDAAAEAAPDAITDQAPLQAAEAETEADEENALLDSLSAALAAEGPAVDAPVAEEPAEPRADEDRATEDQTDWAAEGFAAPESAAQEGDAEIAALTDLVRDFEAEQAQSEPVMAEPAESTDLGFVAASVWPEEDSADEPDAAQAADDAAWDADQDMAAEELAAEQVAAEDGAAPDDLPEAAADALPDALSDMLAAEARLADADADADQATLAQGTVEQEPEAPAALRKAEPKAESEPQSEPQGEPRRETALQRARARVIKVRRIELAEVQVAAQAPREPAADPVLSGIGAALGNTGLSAEDEADLMAELAAVEREVNGPRAAPAPVEDTRAQAPEARAPRRAEIEDAEIVENDAGADRPVLGRGPADEAAVSRLIETANTRLEGTETRRRFSAIAHLKAAVAATVADRALQTQAAGTALAQDSEEAIDRYRDDLTKAVRPRRPGEDAPTGASTPRPMPDRQQAPLVLVSEQRIDRPAETQPQELGAIRPRRVTASALRLTEMLDAEDEGEDGVPAPTPEEARSFADFADRLGANGLADLLEAAAAYTAAVEGRPHFSRPQIIKKVARLAEEADYSREASLRSFGMLLREGKIQKVKRGQFAISDTSRFMSEARRAAR